MNLLLVKNGPPWLDSSNQKRWGRARPILQNLSSTRALYESPLIEVGGWPQPGKSAHLTLVGNSGSMFPSSAFSPTLFVGEKVAEGRMRGRLTVAAQFKTEITNLVAAILL